MLDCENDEVEGERDDIDFFPFFMSASAYDTGFFLLSSSITVVGSEEGEDDAPVVFLTWVDLHFDFLAGVNPNATKERKRLAGLR